jgi:predicted transcriptional regulator
MVEDTGRWKEYSQTLEKSKEYHKRYHIAVSSPLRRKILKLIAEGEEPGKICQNLNLTMKQLQYHLKILEHGFCIRREDDKITLTKEGEVIYYIKS